MTTKEGWVITRPGYGKEPERVVTWYIEPMRSMAIAAASQIDTWPKLYAKGYRCERCRIVITRT